MTGLAGKTVIVTGASKGLGRATAMELASRGAHIYAVARDGQQLTQLTDDLAGSGHRWKAMDVRDEGAWAEVAADCDAIHGVVAAAGIYGPIGRIDQVALSAIRDAFEVNVFGSVLALRSCVPKLIEAKGCAVLFAGGGSEPLPGYDAYVASKAAVVRLAENLAAELAPHGVRVNSVAPGFVATDIHRATVEAGPDLAGSDFHSRTLKAIADGGFPASEAASLVAFLVSPDSAPITGRFISARWDEWRDANWLKTAAEPDMLTMRRIDGALFADARVGS